MAKVSKLELVTHGEDKLYARNESNLSELYNNKGKKVPVNVHKKRKWAMYGEKPTGSMTRNT